VICLWLAGVSMALSKHVKDVRIMLTTQKRSLSLSIAAVFVNIRIRHHQNLDNFSSSVARFIRWASIV
jgi:hypothetical protein